jgi:uncharacterized protein (TIGR02466 family)
MTNQTFKMHGIFPTPVYIAKRDSNLSFKEEKEIRKIIEEEGMYRNIGNSASNNSYIFNGKLNKIKQFCEQQLKLYVKDVICPKEDLEFYITQSWLNITKPGEYHPDHFHSNSLISGVFYISTEEDDRLTFTDPKAKEKEAIKFERKKYNPINSTTWWFPSVINELILFPSWLNHMVVVNEKATTDRISISFNTFVRGALGNRKELTELILK